MKSKKLPTTVLEVSFDPATLSEEEVSELKAGRGRITIFPEGISEDLHRVIASHNTILSSFTGVMRQKYIQALAAVDEEVSPDSPVYREDEVPVILARRMHRFFDRLSENDQHNFVELFRASCDLVDQL